MDAYRKDIDGLRAFAVLPVVLFHAGYSIFSGGFVGVDIFFVISGYLITSIIFRKVRAGEFSLLRFYERRIRRIYPAALTVALVTTLVAALLIPPSLYAKIGRSLVFMNFYATNILFFKQANYFDTESELNPFLHTWSLSVEEQFYVFFPLFLLAAQRLFKTRIFAVLLGATLVSFIAGCAATYLAPTAAFYLIPFRAWELAIGALLAIGRTPEISARKAGALSATGLALIVLSVFAIDEATPFPGFASLLPTMGSALLLFAGAQRANPMNRFMGNAALRYFGLISYSLYLWHWPIFVLARFMYPMGLSPAQQLAQLALAWLCAHLSWRYIEAPFRERAVCAQRAQLFRFFGASTAATLALGVAIVYYGGFAQRLPAHSLAYTEAARDNNPDRDRCHGGDKKNIAADDFCTYGAQHVAPTYALWGDSHGTELTPAIGALLEPAQQSIKMFTYSQCPPALGFSTKARRSCVAHNERVLAYLRSHREITEVFLIAHYRIYETPAYRAAFESGFRAAVSELLASGKKVTVIYPIPGARYSIPLMASALALQREPIETLTIPRAYYAAINTEAHALLDSLEGVERLHPENVLCLPQSCRIALNERLLYFDNSHLNMFGARYVAEHWRESIIARQSPPQPDAPAPPAQLFPRAQSNSGTLVAF